MSSGRDTCLCLTCHGLKISINRTRFNCRSHKHPGGMAQSPPLLAHFTFPITPENYINKPSGWQSSPPARTRNYNYKYLRPRFATNTVALCLRGRRKACPVRVAHLTCPLCPPARTHKHRMLIKNRTWRMGETGGRHGWNFYVSLYKWRAVLWTLR